MPVYPQQDTGGGSAVWADLAGDVIGYEPGVDDIPELRGVTDHNNNDVIFVADPAGWYYYDVSDTTADDGYNIVKPTDVDPGDPGRWRRVNPYTSSIDLGYFTPSGPYTEYNSIGPEVITRFEFQGTKYGGSIHELVVVAGRGGSSGTSTVDVFNKATSTVVASVTVSLAAWGVYKTTVIGALPEDPTVFEIRASKSDVAASRLQLYFVSLRP